MVQKNIDTLVVKLSRLVVENSMSKVQICYQPQTRALQENGLRGPLRRGLTKITISNSCLAQTAFFVCTKILFHRHGKIFRDQVEKKTKRVEWKDMYLQSL